MPGCQPLPPGFIAVACAADPLAAAVLQAASGAEPGSVLHGAHGGRCCFAVVLTPHRPVDEGIGARLAAQALHDALAGLAQVGIPLEIAGRQVLVNGAAAAAVDVRLGPAATDGVPAWLVLGFDIAIDLGDPDPGYRVRETSLAEEGFTAVSGDVLAAICRHLLAGIDAWLHAAPRRAA